MEHSTRCVNRGAVTGLLNWAAGGAGALSSLHSVPKAVAGPAEDPAENPTAALAPGAAWLCPSHSSLR